MENKELIQTVAIIYRYQIMILNQRLSACGMTTGLAPFLLSIENSPGVAMISLSRELFIDKATTTKAVTRLIKGGFIDKVADPKDKRAFKLYLTSKGQEVCREVKGEASIFREEILEGCSQEDYQTTLRVLDRVFENMRQMVSH